MLQYQFRPIDHWPGERTKNRRRSQFSAPWHKTLDLLERELGQLRAKDVVIQAAVTLEDIRNDGMLRASARPSWPGVILSFESKHGPLSYPCDTFNDWQANVRAIALALEALRDVERYGVTRRAEQYQGWARLPPPQQPQSTAIDAAITLQAAARVRSPVTRDNLEELYRTACRHAHPDLGGSPEEFKRVQTAKETLEKSFAGRVEGQRGTVLGES